jgi:plasmid stabilization system protein ParE
VRVVFSDQAERSLKELADHIAQGSVATALSFVRKLRRAASVFFRRTLRIPRHPPPSVSDYLIFYRIEDDQISILHVMHGARDYEALLFGEK